MFGTTCYWLKCLEKIGREYRGFVALSLAYRYPANLGASNRQKWLAYRKAQEITLDRCEAGQFSALSANRDDVDCHELARANMADILQNWDRDVPNVMLQKLPKTSPACDLSRFHRATQSGSLHPHKPKVA